VWSSDLLCVRSQMKTCPQCQRVYEDATLNFCLEDGEWLGAADGSEPATMIFPYGRSQGESATRPQVHTTDQTTIIPAEPKARSRTTLFVAVGLVVVVALGGFFGYRYLVSPNSRQIESIAVLPFENASGNADSNCL